MSSAELADGLLADDDEAIDEDWEGKLHQFKYLWLKKHMKSTSILLISDPALNFKAGKKKQKGQKMMTTTELDKDSVFQQG